VIVCVAEASWSWCRRIRWRCSSHRLWNSQFCDSPTGLESSFNHFSTPHCTECRQL